MKRAIRVSLSGFITLFLLASVTFAQETTEVTVQVKKDGKVMKDTTYQFNDETDAKHAVQMLEMLSGEGLKEMEYTYTMALSDDSESKTMVFVSRDGEKTEISEMTGDSLVWVSEGEGKDGPVKVMKYKVEKGDDTGEDHVVVVTSGEGGTFDILLDEELEGEPGMMKKKIKVIVTEDEDGVTHVSKEEIVDAEEEVYVISGDESEKELKETMEKVKSSEEGENVKVIVIKKKDKNK